jgi:hypothetical protein
MLRCISPKGQEKGKNGHANQVVRTTSVLEAQGKVDKELMQVKAKQLPPFPFGADDLRSVA